MEQLSLQHDELVSQNQRLVQKVDDACRRVLEMAIAVDLPVEVWIHSLASGAHDANEEATNVQLELNLQIVEQRLKAQPSTPPKIREQHASAITTGLEEIGHAVYECTKMLEQVLEVLTTLQEDPNMQRMETEAQKLQQQYDNIRETVQTLILTQRLPRMQQSKALKEQVDTMCHKEEVLKQCIHLWIDEAFTIMADIEGKLAQIQGMNEQM